MVSGKDHGTLLTKAFGRITRSLGSLPAILVASALVLVWVVGLFFVQGGFGNDTYQLVINTITTVVTFLMVFVIQNVQNRESEATQVKLDAMMQALIDLSVRLDIDLDESPLGELVGVEEADEKSIQLEQRKVRAAGTPAHN